MSKWIGHPLRHGIVQHDLGTWDLSAVALSINLVIPGCIPIKFDGKFAEMEITEDQALLIYKDLDKIFGEEK